MNLKNLNQLERNLVLDGELLPRRVPIRKPARKADKSEKEHSKKLSNQNKLAIKSLVSFLKEAIRQGLNPKEIALIIEIKLNKI